jgi:hypothetical protein
LRVILPALMVCAFLAAFDVTVVAAIYPIMFFPYPASATKYIDSQWLGFQRVEQSFLDCCCLYPFQYRLSTIVWQIIRYIRTKTMFDIRQCGVRNWNLRLCTSPRIMVPCNQSYGRRHRRRWTQCSGSLVCITGLTVGNGNIIRYNTVKTTRDVSRVHEYYFCNGNFVGGTLGRSSS